LFKTISSECLSKQQFYNGQNAIVDVNIHYGYNQEDSPVTNHVSIDRGLLWSIPFHSFIYETEHDENLKGNPCYLSLSKEVQGIILETIEESTILLMQILENIHNVSQDSFGISQILLMRQVLVLNQVNNTSIPPTK